MKLLDEYILTRIEPTLHSFEIDGYDKTIEDFKRQLKIIVNDYLNIGDQKANPVENRVSQAASRAVLPSVNPLTVEDLKCCGNCYYFDIIDNKGGVCDKDNNQMPCTKGAICEDWKFDAEK